MLLEEADVAPHRVVTAWLWSRQDAGHYVATSPSGGRCPVPRLHDVGEMIATLAADTPWDAVCMEALYVASTKTAPSILRLAEAAGEILGPVARACAVIRVPSATWRGKVLRLGRCTSDVASARAIACSPILGHGLELLSTSEHVCEALAIAYYGLVVTQQGGHDGEAA